MNSILFKVQLFALSLLASVTLSYSQQDIDVNFDSQILSEFRNIHIHIPESYKDTIKSYPVIYALDGDYSKLTLNGLVDFYSFWDKIPECIVVSIDQNYMDSTEHKYKRWVDCTYSRRTGLPTKTSILFQNFISKELVPYIDNTYRTTKFRTILGHSFTANFINYFLLEKEPTFNGYIAISPYYAENSLDSLKSQLEKIKDPIFYFVASGERDLSGHIESVNEFDKKFSSIKSELFRYKKFEMKNNQATHYTVLPIALPSAIEHIFSKYTLIDEEEFKNILKEEDKVGYLVNRYKAMEEIYGVKVPIREMDINWVAYAISKKKQWNQLKQMAEITIKIYPDSYLGYWTMGEYYEKIGEYATALEQYKSGFNHLGDEVINKDDFQKDIDRVAAKIK